MFSIISQSTGTTIVVYSLKYFKIIQNQNISNINFTLLSFQTYRTSHAAEDNMRKGMHD